MKQTILALLLCLVMPVIGHTATITVPDDFLSIQAAVSGAVSGDTVLVRPGTYLENIDLAGKAISVVSEYGPGVTIIDGGSPLDPAYGSVVRFTSGESSSTVLRGFTLRNGTGTLSGGTSFGGGVYCQGASPMIAGNVIEQNSAGAGGGVGCESSASPTLYQNLIKGNSATDGAGIFCIDFSSPTMACTVIAGNTAVNQGGGLAAIFHSSPELRSSTLTGNQANEGGGLFCLSSCLPYITNSILWNNNAVTGKEAVVASSSWLTANYSDVEGGQALVYVEPGSNLTWGVGMINDDPLFVSGQEGDWYLSQTAAGQGSDSPCLHAGSNPPSSICFSTDQGTVFLDQLTTRTDLVPDSGWTDMGYHRVTTSGEGMISTQIVCLPSSGTLPFQTSLTATMSNHYRQQPRRLAARIHVTPAGGTGIANWRSGYTNVTAEGSFVTGWLQSIPALGSLVGDNIFRLMVEDVTPAPYNLAPYPPAGDGDSDVCTVTGLLP